MVIIEVSIDFCKTVVFQAYRCYDVIMGDSDKYNTYSLRSCKKAPAVTRIIDSAITAADPYLAVKNHIKRSGDQLQIGDQIYNLNLFSRIKIIAIGKAAPSMADALLTHLDNNDCTGFVVTKHAESNAIGPLRVLKTGHPLPDERSLFAGEQIVNFCKGATETDLVICLISGGGSSLITYPKKGVSLADLQYLTNLLLRCSASIYEINTLRRHLDLIKGGGLVRFTTPAQVISLILSDVVGDPLEAIASGLTAPDPTTSSDALNIITRYGLLSSIPQPILSAIENETLKPGDPLFDRVHNFIIGNNSMSAQAALAQAQKEGFHTILLTTSLQGEASLTGSSLASTLRQTVFDSHSVSRPACLVAGGETTVTIRGDGCGGRNQELALGAVISLAGLNEVMLVSLATDGEDGSTDAAGAIVTGDSRTRAAAMGLDVCDHLDRNDSYTFFHGLGDLLKIGPTGTNVNDLIFLFAF